MDVFEGPYYVRCKRFLSFCGHWPYQDSINRILNQVLLMTVTLTIFAAQAAKLFEIRHSFHYFVLGVPSFLFYVQFILKTLFAALKRKEIKNALDKIDHDFQEFKYDELEILRDYSATARTINTYYTAYMLTAAVAYSALPLALHLMDIAMPLANATRLAHKPRLIKYHVDRFDDDMMFIIIHGSLSDLMTATFMLGFDMLYCSLVHHICALFVIVASRMLNSLDMKNQLGRESSKQSEKRRNIIYENIVETIIAHKYALELVNTLESAFSVLNLMSIGCTFITMTITGFEVVLFKANTSEMVRFIGFAVGELTHLLFYNWPGQKIRDHSLLVYQSCYNSKWYEEGITDKHKKLLNLMMLRSQKTCYLTAGKVYILGLENFAAVVKLSISYFAVLKSMM